MMNGTLPVNDEVRQDLIFYGEGKCGLSFVPLQWCEMPYTNNEFEVLGVPPRYIPQDQS
jgi:hypothetical protein